MHTATLLLHCQQTHAASPVTPRATPLQRLHSDEEDADVRFVRSQDPKHYLDVAARYLTGAEAALNRIRAHRRDVTFVLGAPGV